MGETATLFKVLGLKFLACWLVHMGLWVREYEDYLPP